MPSGEGFNDAEAEPVEAEELNGREEDGMGCAGGAGTRVDFLLDDPAFLNSAGGTCRQLWSHSRPLVGFAHFWRGVDGCDESSVLLVSLAVRLQRKG